MELYKYFTRFNVVLVSVLLCANLIVAAVSTGQYWQDKATVRDTVDTLLYEYETDPALYRRYYEDFMMRERSWMFSQGEFENRLIDLPQYGERALFADVGPVVERVEGYGRDISKVINSALKRVSDPEVTKGSYVYEYQAQLLLHYRPLAELEIPAEGQYGWNEYFEMKLPILLAAVAGVAVFSGVWLGEKRNRTTNILRICKYGGARLTAVKLASASCVSVVLTLLFMLTPLLSLSFTRGFSSLSHPVQALSLYEYCPYVLTVGQFLVWQILSQIVLFLLFDLLAVFLGQVLDHEIPVFGILLLLLAVSFLVSGLETSSPLYGMKQFNFLDLASGSMLFDRYRAVNCMGTHLGLIPALIGISVLLGALLLGLPFFIGLRADRYRRLRLKLPSFPQRENASHPMAQTLSLFRVELGKLLGSPAAVFLILAALTLKVFLSAAYFTPPEGQYWEIYRGYVEELRGPVTEVKAALVREEMRYVASSISRYDAIVEKYRQGEATDEELRDASDRKNYANLVETPLERVRERIDYLADPELADYDGLEILDETSVMKLFSEPVDFTLLFLFVILFSDVFVREYRTGFRTVLHIQKRGGIRTWGMKFTTVLVSAACLFVLFAAADLCCMLVHTDRTVFSAGLLSIPDMRGIGLNISIGRYIVLIEAVRFVGVLLSAAVIAGLSALTRKLVFQFVASFMVLLVPPLLTVVDVSVPKAVSIAGLLAPSDLTAVASSFVIWMSVAAVLSCLAGIVWEKT